MNQPSIILVDCGPSKKWQDKFPHISLGLLSCQQYLYSRGIAAQLISSEALGIALPFQPDDVEGFIENMVEEKPDFIGFSCTSDSLPCALYLADQIKSRQTKSKSTMIFGGIGPTSYPQELLQHYPFVDLIVIGEGESTLLDIVTSKTNADSWARINGIAFRESTGNIRLTPPRPRCRHLDDYPLVYSEARYKVPTYTHERHSIFAVTSRGCTGNCLFCSHSLIWKRNVTAHSAEAVATLLASIANGHPGAHVAFQDDDILFSATRIYQLTELICERKIQIPWAIFGRLDRITPELAMSLAEAGCSSMIFGLDAASDEAGRRLNKPWNYHEVLPKLQFVREIIPNVEVNIIFSWPGESRADFNLTLKRAYTLREQGFTVKMTPLTFYPNTPIHQMYRQKLDLSPNQEIFSSLLGQAYHYVKNHEQLYPHFNANCFDPDYQWKKRMLSLVNEAIVVYQEI